MKNNTVVIIGFIGSVINHMKVVALSIINKVGLVL